MAYVIELLFDAEAEARIRDLWQRIRDAGHPSPLDAPGYRPHITLAVSDAAVFDVAACRARLTDFAQTWSPFPIRLNHLGLFQTMNNVVFLGVTPSAPLLALHREVFGLCKALATDWRDYYLPGRWTPHVSLGFELTPQQAQAILALTWGMPLPIHAHARAFQLVRVSPSAAQNLILCHLRGAM